MGWLPIAGEAELIDSTGFGEVIVPVQSKSITSTIAGT